MGITKTSVSSHTVALLRAVAAAGKPCSTGEFVRITSVDLDSLIDWTADGFKFKFDYGDFSVTECHSLKKAAKSALAYWFGVMKLIEPFSSSADYIGILAPCGIKSKINVNTYYGNVHTFVATIDYDGVKVSSSANTQKLTSEKEVCYLWLRGKIFGSINEVRLEKPAVAADQLRPAPSDGELVKSLGALNIDQVDDEPSRVAQPPVRHLTDEAQTLKDCLELLPDELPYQMIVSGTVALQAACSAKGVNPVVIENLLEGDQFVARFLFQQGVDIGNADRLLACVGFARRQTRFVNIIALWLNDMVETKL